MTVELPLQRRDRIGRDFGDARPERAMGGVGHERQPNGRRRREFSEWVAGMNRRPIHVMA
ncbi:hypothetical protein [Nonomuraea jabiensis]|uniref:hypothetical protein n=1 Tax=Nonomuraea jabiensis TaxID=882448 RepID=UPI0036D1CE37